MWSIRMKRKSYVTALLWGSVWWFGQLLAAHMISSSLFFSSVGSSVNFCSGWKAETTLPPVSWVFIEPHFLGWPAGGSHTHCTIWCLHSHFTRPICQVLVWCDKATVCRWPLHLSATLCEWESVCVFVLSVWCWSYLCQWCMAKDHMKWLTALAWPKFFYHSVIVRSMCDASQLRQYCRALMCCPEVSSELVSESVHSARGEWDLREAMTLTYLKKKWIIDLS